jgi:transcriptional regulator with XRE-family HTH domain
MTKYYKKLKGYSISQVAEEIGIQPKTLYEWLGRGDSVKDAVDNLIEKGVEREGKMKPSRKLKGLRVIDVATEAGVSRYTVHNYLTGKAPRSAKKIEAAITKLKSKEHELSELEAVPN